MQAPIDGVHQLHLPGGGRPGGPRRRRDPELAKNPLIFPDKADFDNPFIFRDLKPDEERELNDAFQKLIGA